MTSPRCYVVRWNASWQHKPGWVGCQHFSPEPAYGVVRAFGSREAAEAFRAEREEQTRRMPPRRHPFWDVLCNPFWTVPALEFDVAALSSMDWCSFDDR